MSAESHALRLAHVLCSVRTSRIEGVATKTFNEVFGHLIAHGMTPDELYDAVCKQVNFRPQGSRHALFMLECTLPQ